MGIISLWEATESKELSRFIFILLIFLNKSFRVELCSPSSLCLKLLSDNF